MEMTTLRNIAAFAPALAAPDFVAGQWAEPERLPNGAITLPWFNLSPTATEFVAAFATDDVAAHYKRPWPDAERAMLTTLALQPEAMAKATVEQIGWILTYHSRADRFVEGSLAQAFDTGLMRAIAERAAILAAESQTQQKPR